MKFIRRTAEYSLSDNIRNEDTLHFTRAIYSRPSQKEIRTVKTKMVRSC